MKGQLNYITMVIIILVIIVVSVVILSQFTSKFRKQIVTDFSEASRKVCAANFNIDEKLADIDNDRLPDSCDACLGAPFVDVNNNLISDYCEPKEFEGEVIKIKSACDQSPACPSGKCWSDIRSTCELDCYKAGECNI